MSIVAANGTVLDDVPSEWWCTVHKRHLVYQEWKDGGCSWCDPSGGMMTIRRHTEGEHKGQPLTPTWKHREKIFKRVLALSPEQRAGTAPMRIGRWRQESEPQEGQAED